MARDEGRQPSGDDTETGEEPTAIATAAGGDETQATRERSALWADEPSGATPDDDISASASTQQADSDAEAQAADPAAERDGTPDGDEARRQVDAALAKVAEAKERAGARISDARSTAGDRAADAKGKAAEVKDKAGSKAGEARQRVGALAAGARDRAASTDVKELAASTTSLIDTARPFFLAFFAGLFTLLGFIEGDSGTSQLFVIGAILFVLAAGFSDEIGRLSTRRRRDGADD